MTVALSARDVAARIQEQFPGSVVESGDSSIILKGEALLKVASFLKSTPEFDFNYLTSVTAVDYRTHLEVVYHLASLTHNHSLVLKVRCADRNKAVVPSVISVWRGADLQEREIYDLMGIRFEGRPNLKRIVLWEGFNGHPLRKDWKSD
ncbi:MAG: NADH-quinone oxidoreductase subunit C [Chloroflexi bacterium]|nr:NADH-quinone oxidoreductase subunit C [Chloroflexota bacterium]